MTTANGWPNVRFEEFLKPNKRPYLLGPTEDANLVGMRLYGQGPFHRELKAASKIQKKSHFVIRTDDVIYNKLFAWKGTFGIVPPELDGMYVSDKFPTYALDQNQVHSAYLRWYFRYPPLWEQARQMSVGSAALSKLTLNPPRFMDLTIPLPPLTEQQHIAGRIDDLAIRIKNAQRLRGESIGHRLALRRSALRGITEQFAQFGELRRVLSGKPRNGWSAKCDNADDGVAVLALSAVTGFTFNSAAFKRTSLETDPNAHYWLSHGDFLITRSNTPQLVGHCAIYNGDPYPCIFPDLMMRLELDLTLVDPAFVWCWLQTPLVREYIEASARGTSPTMKKIAQGIVMQIPFPRDITLDEQRQILAQFDSIQSRLRQLSRLQDNTAAELDALLPSILDRAFKGEL